jgi:hypothetical protein
MNVNQLTKLFSSMGGRQMLRFFSKRRGMGKSRWMYVALSGIAAAFVLMVRRNNNKQTSMGGKSVIFKQHNKRENGMPFAMQQLLTTEFAEDFFQNRKNHSPESSSNQNGKK